MKRVKLGRSGIEVSEICLGSMTWGTQNTEAEGHAQLDYALAQGIDFIDTAELYPVNPVSAETSGRTEEIIGTWIKARGRRDDLVIASKISGAGVAAVRGGEPITPASLRRALEGSLTRLQTDYIDLYQLHWPNRGSYHFRQNWRYDASKQDRAAVQANMDACIETLGAMVAEGKIRAVGLSNESAWGTAQWLARAERGQGPRMATIQNEYSLLCRLYDLDLAELAAHEDVTLLAYSALGAGLLGGQYQGGTVIPEGTRRTKVPDLSGRVTPRVWAAIEAYHAIAREHGLDPVTMAIAFTMNRPFPVIPIIGGRSVEQLMPAVAAAGLTLSDEILRAINAAHHAHPMPF